MGITNEILILELNKPEDYNNFHLFIENKLNTINFPEKKKIIISCIELIQNNIIHNNNIKLKLRIFRDEQFIYVESEQIVRNEDYKKISGIIQEINSMDLIQLKNLYSQNITKEIRPENYPGNGFITCRLKSKNKIETKVIQDIKSNESALQITLKFKSHD